MIRPPKAPLPSGLDFALGRLDRVGRRASPLLVGGLLFLCPEVQGIQKPAAPPLPDLDRRPKAHTAAAPARTAALAHLHELLPSAQVDFDKDGRGPSFVFNRNGFLSGPQGQGGGVSQAAALFEKDDPHRAIKAFLHEHRALFGHGPELLEGARVTREFVTPHHGMRTVVWQQQLDDIPVFEGVLIAHTTQHGELLSVSSLFLPDPARGAEAGRRGRPGIRAEPTVSAQAAVAVAAQNIGEVLSAEDVTEPAPQNPLPGHWRRWRAPGLRGDISVRLTWLPVSTEALRLCWDLVLTSQRRWEMFRVVVDAVTAEVWLRHSLNAYLSPASYRVFTSDSPTPLSPGHPLPLTNQPPPVARSLLTLTALDTNASPLGWILEDCNETRGNNGEAHYEYYGDEVTYVGWPQGEPFQVFDCPLDLSRSPGHNSEAAVVQSFYWCNWIHDQLYQLGFTEAAGNFQKDNFGRGGLENDPLDAVFYLDSPWTLRNNAWMSTPPDGSPPWMALLVFDGPAPHRASALEAEVILHEYTHGLSNRRVGGGLGLRALQSRGLGEGWSDFFALALLSEAGDNVDGTYAFGAYLAYEFTPGFRENYYFGIRRYPYTTDLTKNPLTFRDIDPGQADPHENVPFSPLFSPFSTNQSAEVHCQGEFWGVTLWEARANLIKKHGFSSGHELMLQLVTDGMNLTPPNPNFVQARDAILLADRVLAGGANRQELWAAFAKRGLGFSARAPSSGSTSGVQEAFDLPDILFIHPPLGFTATGPAGGPFLSRSQTYEITNLGTNTLNWTAVSTSLWLHLSPRSGVLVPGGPGSVLTVSLSAVAEDQSPGVYQSTVHFTHSDGGQPQSRSFMLRIGQRDYFTQRFTDDNDLSYHQFTFTPNGSTDFYAVCREPATHFPTDPAGGQRLFALASADACQQVRLSESNEIALYGRRTNMFYIGSNGYLTLGQGDRAFQESESSHFALPRISMLYDDLEPEFAGTVSWKELSDRVAVTFEQVPEYYGYNVNSFQAELFYDGIIRLTYLRLDALDGLAGLSSGNGLHANYWPSDFSAYRTCAPALLLEAPDAATEGDGLLVGAGRVLLPERYGTGITVQMTSSNPGEVTLPASLLIPAGEVSAVFDLQLGDDALLNGTREVGLIAAADGFAEGTTRLLVHDNESARLQLTLPAYVIEGAGSADGVVTASAPPTVNVPVILTTSDPTEMQTPPSAILPAGQTSAVFVVTVMDDQELDGDQEVAISARVVHWTDGTAHVVVQDNDPALLTVALPYQAMENDGPQPSAGQVRLAATLPTNLTVSLVSSDETELMVPANATIPAGQIVTHFDLALVDDAKIDGMQTVTVTASAPGFSEGAGAIRIYDDESVAMPDQPSPADQACQISADADLAWRSRKTTGETVTNDVFFGPMPVPGPAQFLGSTTNTTWPLPRLEPATTYSWQIVTHGAGTTPGPIWQFTTRGVDHFHWAPMASPQYVKQPFPAAVTARDEWDRLVSNFNDPVRLTGFVAQPVALFREDFEDGDAHGWSLEDGDFVLAVANDTAAAGRFSVCFSGRSYGRWGGATYYFDPSNLTPWHVSFAVRAAVTNAAGGCFRLHDGDDEDILFTLGADGLMGVESQETGDRSVRVPYSAQHWHRISLRFDWEQHSLAFYVDDQRIDPSLSFDSSSAGIEHMNFFNQEDTQTWWDEIQVHAPPLERPVALEPSSPVPASNGLWTGTLTVLEPVEGLSLMAEDLLRHSGISAPVSIVLQDDLCLVLHDGPGPALAGSNLTYTLTVSNTGPALSTGVVVTNLLPDSVELVTLIVTQGVFTVLSNHLVFDLGSLEGGRAATLGLVVRSTDGRTLTNTALLGRIEPEAVTSNNVVVAVTRVRPAVVPGATQVAEGNTGLREAIFPVRLSGPSNQEIRVAYETADGTAHFGSDFVFQAGTLFFAPGILSNEVRVPVCGDIEPESDEIFQIILVGATNGFLAQTAGAGMILNDDGRPGEVHTLEWGPMASPQYEGLAFWARLSAHDAAHRVVDDFKGPTALSGWKWLPTLETIGPDDISLHFPLNTRYQSLRTQVLYPAQEVGGPARITSLALHVLQTPVERAHQWTIRLKHTPLQDFTNPVWERHGWTVVCQTNLLVASIGWLTCQFDTPFDYNGTDNLMIDFCFQNSTFSSSSILCSGTVHAVPRTLWLPASPVYGDPLTWNGRNPRPSVYGSTHTPNLQLGLQRKVAVPIQPNLTSGFSAGRWTEQLRVLTTTTNLFLTADDLDGHRGLSSAIEVHDATDLDADGLPDSWELHYFGAINTPGGGPQEDQDRDGLSNSDEFRAGTIPTARASLLRVTRVEWSDDEVRISFRSVAGKCYQLQGSPTLTNPDWAVVVDNIFGTGEEVQAGDQAQANQASRFYRVRLLE